MSLTDIIAPTIERQRKGSFAKPDVSRNRDVRAWRDVSVPEKMGLDRELLNGWDDFESDWIRSQREPASIGGYGERVPSGDDVHGKAARIADSRIEADRAVKRALADVGDPTTGDVLLALLAGLDVEAIGRTVLGRSNSPQARAAAQERIAMGCRQLAIHYGHVCRPRGDP
jgi:hypothetical protein